MPDEKYIFTDESIMVGKRTLHRIKATKNFGNVKAGDLGGFIEFKENLSQIGTCWIAEHAQVYENAHILEDAQIYGWSRVYGHANILGNARIYGNASVYGYSIIFKNAQICGNTEVFGNAKIYDGILKNTRSYICLGPVGSRSDYVTFFQVNDKIMVACGCFNDSIFKFNIAVHNTHYLSQYEKDYHAVISFVERYFYG